ncbi:MAG: hypothetical protein ACOCSL_00935 [Thermoplasmatota archaeon]
MIDIYKLGPYVIRDITRYCPHIYEIVDGIFDDIFSILSDIPRTFIYGGIIRDVIADMPIKGDIDIITDVPKQVQASFDKNYRWLQRIETEEDLIKLKTGYDLGGKKRKGSISSITSYVNASGNIAQVISYADKAYDNDGLIKNVIEHLDFTCCGFVMDFNGRVFEILEGAIKDCEQKAIRVNPNYKGTFYKERFNKRKDKLEERGWVFVGDMDKIEFAPEEENKDTENHKDKKDSKEEKVWSMDQVMNHYNNEIESIDFSFSNLAEESSFIDPPSDIIENSEGQEEIEISIGDEEENHTLQEVLSSKPKSTFSSKPKSVFTERQENEYAEKYGPRRDWKHFSLELDTSSGEVHQVEVPRAEHSQPRDNNSIHNAVLNEFLTDGLLNKIFESEKNKEKHKKTEWAGEAKKRFQEHMENRGYTAKKINDQEESGRTSEIYEKYGMTFWRNKTKGNQEESESGGSNGNR